MLMCFFFFNDTATTEIYTLSLHDALPICSMPSSSKTSPFKSCARTTALRLRLTGKKIPGNERQPSSPLRSEEHTSELQSRQYLVCRLLLEKKKTTTN